CSGGLPALPPCFRNPLLSTPKSPTIPMPAAPSTDRARIGWYWNGEPNAVETAGSRRAAQRYLHDARIGEAPEQDLHRAGREGLRLPRLLPVARPAHGGTGDRRALPRTCHPALRARAGPTAKVSPARVVRAALDEVDRCRRPRVHGLLRGVPGAGGCCQRAQVLRGATNTLYAVWNAYTGYG